MILFQSLTANKTMELRNLVYVRQKFQKPALNSPLLFSYVKNGTESCVLAFETSGLFAHKLDFCIHLVSNVLSVSTNLCDKFCCCIVFLWTYKSLVLLECTQLFFSFFVSSQILSHIQDKMWILTLTHPSIHWKRELIQMKLII